MPLHRRQSNSEKFASVSSLIEANVQIELDGGAEELMESFPVVGEVIQSFDVSDAPGGWHLVWLDEAFEFEEQSHAYLLIAARWVARPIARGQAAPVNIRFVPDVAVVQKGSLDVERLPMAGKGTAILL